MKQSLGHRSAFLPAFFFIICLFQCIPPNKDFKPEIIQEAKDRYVTIYFDNDMPKGTGFFINDKGYMLTAFHIVGAEPTIRVGQTKDEFHTVKVVYQEPKFDLMLLVSDWKPKVRPLVWIDRSDLEINDSVFVIGTPLELTGSFMKGYISSLERKGFDMQFPEIPYIQTYGTSFQGVSGAAVYLADGRIIGLNRATFGTAFGNSFGLVIPKGFIDVFLGQAEEAGKFTR